MQHTKVKVIHQTQQGNKDEENDPHMLVKSFRLGNCDKSRKWQRDAPFIHNQVEMSFHLHWASSTTELQ